jgi:hypothetical protein
LVCLGDIILKHHFIDFILKHANKNKLCIDFYFKVDDYTRLKEMVTKTMIQSVMDSNLISFENWLNSSEV